VTRSTRRPRDVLKRVLRDGNIVARQDGTIQDVFPVSVSADEGEALRKWVTGEHASRTVEVGLGYGVAALFVCDGLLATGGDAHHVTIDPHQESRFANCGLQLLEEAGVGDLVEFHAAESQIVLPRLLAQDRTFDLAVVDGNHRFDGVFVDLVYLGRLVRPGGIIVVDDYQLRSVARAVSFCTTNLGWKAEEVSTGDTDHHWAVLRTAIDPPERRYDHYVEF
jgi:predicted O-methyltransferase YrrM